MIYQMVALLTYPLQAMVGGLRLLCNSTCQFMFSTYIGDVVMAIAWGIGAVVTIVSIMMWLMIMMLSRALVAFVLDKLGILGITFILGATILLTMKFGHVSFQLISNIFIKSCN